MRKYINEFTGEALMLNPTKVLYEARLDKILGRRDETIYMHYRAWQKADSRFLTECKNRKLHIVVVY